MPSRFTFVLFTLFYLGAVPVASAQEPASSYELLKSVRDNLPGGLWEGDTLGYPCQVEVEWKVSKSNIILSLVAKRDLDGQTPFVDKLYFSSEVPVDYKIEFLVSGIHDYHQITGDSPDAIVRATIIRDSETEDIFAFYGFNVHGKEEEMIFGCENVKFVRN